MIEVSWQLLYISGFVLYCAGCLTIVEVYEGRKRRRAAKAKENMIGRLR